jgi:hypothetical protein
LFTFRGFPTRLKACADISSTFGLVRAAAKWKEILFESGFAGLDGGPVIWSQPDLFSWSVSQGSVTGPDRCAPTSVLGGVAT